MTPVAAGVASHPAGHWITSASGPKVRISKTVPNEGRS